MKITDDIRRHPLFYGIKDEDFDGMLSCLGAYMKRYKKGEIIFLSDEPVKSIGIVISGSIYIVKEYENGDSSIMLTVSAGEMLGESFACGSLNTSKVIFQTASESDILFIPFHKVIHTCNMTCAFHHRIIENMVRLISDKNVALMEKMEITSRKTLREKIMAYLLNQVEKQGSSSVAIPLNRVSFAEYLCADRSALSRELSNMQREGMIEIEKNKFTIL